MTQLDAKDYCMIVLLPLGAGFLLCGYRCFRKGWADDFHVTRVVPADAVAGTIVSTSVGTGTPTAEETESLRKQVLKKIFPVDDQKEEGKRSVLAYDVETNKYTLQNDTDVASPSCSICLEEFGTFECMFLLKIMLCNFGSPSLSTGVSSI